MLALNKYRKAGCLEFAWCQHKAASNIPVNEGPPTSIIDLLGHGCILDGGVYIDEDPILF